MTTGGNLEVMFRMSVLYNSFPGNHSLPENPQILQQKTLILLLEPENSTPREKMPYICGLRARIECEPLSEHSTHSDRVTNIGHLLSGGASVLPAATQNFLQTQGFQRLFFYKIEVLFCKVLGYSCCTIDRNESI